MLAPKKNDDLSKSFRLTAIEACKENGLYWAASTFWALGVAVLVDTHQFGGTLTDAISGWIDIAAIGISFAFGNRAYSSAATLAVAAAGIQQLPYMREGDISIYINYTAMTLGTVPAMAERWIKPAAEQYLEKAAARKKSFKSTVAYLCANGRATGSVIQNCCHVPVAIVSYEAKDYALLGALGLFALGNTFAGVTKRSQS